MAHPRADSLSNYELARHCGVNESTIRRHRKDLRASTAEPQMRDVTRGGRTYRQNATNIGNRQKKRRDGQKGKKRGKRISPNAAVPVLGHSLPNPSIALNLSPNNPVTAAATIFKLFDSTFVRALVAELAKRLKGAV